MILIDFGLNHTIKNTMAQHFTMLDIFFSISKLFIKFKNGQICFHNPKTDFKLSEYI